MLESLDAPAVRRWCRTALDSLGQAREEIDALNVYPVPDGDTGTNLYLTLEATAEAATDTPDTPDDLTVTLRRITHAALMGARGNSGVILSQLLRGIADALTASPVQDGAALRRGLARASELGYAAVAKPVEGTILSVAKAAATAAADSADDSLAAVATAAAEGAREALRRTPDQLDVLRRAGVVDAGGRGLCVVLDALVAVVTGVTPMAPARAPVPKPERGPAADATEEAGYDGPAFEVMYLLDSEDDAVPALKETLAGLGDSLVVVGGDGLWNVHVHTDEVGAVIEAGIEAGRPHRIRVTHLALAAGRTPAGDEAARRGVVCVAYGAGLAALFESAGATVVSSASDQEGGVRRPSTAELLDAILRAHTDEVVLLPNDVATHAVAEVAAERARAEGVRVAVIPTRASVQAIAALAVHDPGRRFDDDVVSMTSAAGATRFAELTVAQREAWTMAGVCQPGDVLGLIEGDVAVIGRDLTGTGVTVVDRMLAGGGELVTLVTGEHCPQELGPALVEHLHTTRPEVDTVVYEGGQAGYPLLVGVE